MLHVRRRAGVRVGGIRTAPPVAITRCGATVRLSGSARGRPTGQRRPSTRTPSPSPTRPITRQVSGSSVPVRERRGQRVVVTAGDHPHQRVDVERRARPRAAWPERPARRARRSMRTPLASAMWPRSATRPSLTSVIAVAPSSAARGPSAYGSSGRRCAVTTDTGERKPRPSTAKPAAAQPSRPAHRDDVARAGRRRA